MYRKYKYDKNGNILDKKTKISIQNNKLIQDNKSQCVNCGISYLTCKKHTSYDPITHKLKTVHCIDIKGNRYITHKFVSSKELIELNKAIEKLQEAKSQLIKVGA